MERGYITLISVLLVGAVGTAIATSLLLSGISSSDTSLAAVQSAEARSLADACAEEALQQIRLSTSFSGYGSLQGTHGACGYLVVNTGGSNRTISASSTVGLVVRKVSVSVTGIMPLIVVSSWQEVAD